ncbi:dhh family protein, partial [Cystoisospora suis]
MASEQRSREEVIPSSSSSPPLQSVAEKRKEEISIEATTDKKTTFHASQDKETEIAVGSLVGSFSSSSLSKVSLPRHLFISVTSPPSLRRYLYSHVSPLETSPSSCCIADIKSLDSSSSSLSSSPPSSYSFSSLILKELKAWRDTSSSFSSSSSSFSPSISSSRGVCWQERLLLERRESLPSFLSSASAFLKAVKERIRGIEKDIASPRRNKGDFAEDTTASAESSQEKKRKGEEEKKEKKEKSPEDDVVLILGNPSADLDSIAAAIGYAMFLETCRYLLDGLLFSSITFPPRVERKDEEEKSIEEEEERKKDQQEKTKKKEREEGTGEGLTSSYLPRFLPVVQCLKKEYKFRLQTRWWMEIALGKRIDQEEKEEEEMFLFIDHPVIFKLLEEKLDMWQVPLLGLVDHNALSLRLAPLQPNVVSIVDHHVPDPHLLSFSFSSSSSASDGLHVYPVVSPGLPLAVDIPGPSIGSCCTLIFQLV